MRIVLLILNPFPTATAFHLSVPTNLVEVISKTLFHEGKRI
jgi:hypothetical protein